MKHIFIRILVVALFYACGQQQNERGSDDRAQREDVKHLQALGSAGLDFSKTDSVELIYFPDPRQQKDYRFRGSSDTAFIHALVDNLNDSAITASSCTHYKKLYLFARGEVFKTIYVSDSCNYLAFAVNGQQEFRKLTSRTKRMIGQQFGN